MRLIKIISAAIAFIPSFLAYTLSFVVAAVWSAATEGWDDGK